MSFPSNSARRRHIPQFHPVQVVDLLVGTVLVLPHASLFLAAYQVCEPAAQCAVKKAGTSETALCARRPFLSSLPVIQESESIRPLGMACRLVPFRPHANVVRIHHHLDL
jgi:hypothetical protein